VSNILPNFDFRDLADLERDDAEAAMRARVQTVYIGDNTILARVLGSYKIFLSATDLGFACHVMLDGFWESWLTLFFARTIREGMVVIDVGANFGYYTLLFGAMVGQSGRVIAIEPSPNTVRFLRKTVELNGLSTHTQIFENAADAKAGETVRLYVNALDPKNDTVVNSALPGSVIVSTITIDDICADFKKVDMIKIDAEGAEERIVAGMSQTIERFSPTVVLEFNAARYKDARGFLDQLMSKYRRVEVVGYDGRRSAVSIEDVLTKNFGTDWLLIFDRA
jgi:FkbM family methyltransferase